MILTLKQTNCIFRYSLLSLLFIFLSNVVSARAAGVQLQAVYDFEVYRVMEYRQNRLQLTCVPGNNNTNVKLEWRRGDKVIKESERYKIDQHSMYIERPTDDDVGNYTCADTISNSSATITVISRPFARLPENTIVIEGEHLKLDCQATGVPAPVIKWKIGNDFLNGSTDRVILEPNDKGVPNAILSIKEVALEDRNTYTCIASNIANYDNKTMAISSITMVRVKDKLAALWPFLGICAEVFVLCAIILIYEKKRNKAELEESDTDNSPEQKNTPDHGKDSVRHRK